MIRHCLGFVLTATGTAGTLTEFFSAWLRVTLPSRDPLDSLFDLFFEAWFFGSTVLDIFECIVRFGLWPDFALRMESSPEKLVRKVVVWFTMTKR